MPRRHLPQALLAALAAVTLGLLGPACLAVDEQSSPQTSKSSVDDHPLQTVDLEKLELPDPNSEGLLCVTLSSDAERTLDEVAVVTAGQSKDTLHTFSELNITDDGMKSCTSTCLCYGDDPPPLDIVLRDGDAERRVAAGESAPAGCCEDGT